MLQIGVKVCKRFNIRSRCYYYSAINFLFIHSLKHVFFFSSLRRSTSSLPHLLVTILRSFYSSAESC